MPGCKRFQGSLPAPQSPRRKPNGPKDTAGPVPPSFSARYSGQGPPPGVAAVLIVGQVVDDSLSPRRVGKSNTDNARRSLWSETTRRLPILLFLSLSLSLAFISLLPFHPLARPPIVQWILTLRYLRLPTRPFHLISVSTRVRVCNHCDSQSAARISFCPRATFLVWNFQTFWTDMGVKENEELEKETCSSRKTRVPFCWLEKLRRCNICLSLQNFLQHSDSTFSARTLLRLALYSLFCNSHFHTSYR